MVDQFADGVWFVDLAPSPIPPWSPVTVGAALGLRDQPGRSTMDVAAAGSFATARMLLVLDNCEHLLDACAALIADLIGGCPKLTILATSREPIGMSGEVTLAGAVVVPGRRSDRVVHRPGPRARARLRVTADNADAVAEICRRLDGIPLAIELAAARVRSLSLDRDPRRPA